LAGLCIPFTYYGANRDQGTLFRFTGTLWGKISPDLLLARYNSIFGKGQQAVGAGVDGVWGVLTFEERYLASLEKEAQRKEAGKTVHQTVLRSIEKNKERLEITQELRRHLHRSSNGGLS
jgi:hypothetical protein